jgi:hypothetical protein
MNVKLPVLIGLTFGIAAFVATAQPATAEVSIEIISRSGLDRGLNARTDTQSSFQPTAPVNEPNKRTDGTQHQSDISLEAESEQAEPSEDDFEGIVIRI